jgi:adenylate kinase family enzyme
LKRVAIIGCGGSGKSFLARKLGRRTGLPVVHLDALYWNAQWKPQPSDAWEAKVRQLVNEDAWIIDGNYGGTMDIRLAAADTIIFLDVPTHICLRRILLRRIKAAAGRRRNDIPGRERLTWEFVRWVLGYRKTRRPAVIKRLATLDPEARVVILRSKRAGRKFVESLPPR